MSEMSEKFTVAELVERAIAGGKEFLDWFDSRETGLDAWEAGWVRGLALREAGRLREAAREFTTAAEQAASVDDRAVARVRSSRSLVLLALGEIAAASEDADWAAQHLEGAELGRNHSQRAGILYRMGRHREALMAWESALGLLDAHGDSVAAARLRRTRGAIHALMGDLESAREDLRASLQVAVRIADPIGEAISEANLGFVEGRAGDVPAALAHFDRAEVLLRQTSDDARLAESAVDRAEVLADAGLLEEALEKLSDAIKTLRDAHEGTVVSDAQLLMARLYSLMGRHDEAMHVATTARAAFENSNRPGWAMKAAWTEMTAAHDQGNPIDLGGARSLASQLTSFGWHLESQSLLLVATEAALRAGDVPVARQLVADLRRGGRDIPSIMRVGHHRAIAGLRFVLGDRPGARRAATEGLKLLYEYRMTHGSAELRAHAGRHGDGLAAIAIQLAVEDDRPDDALVTLDMLRDTEQPRYSRPPTDSRLATDLAELRRLDAVLRDAAREGMPDRGAEIQRAAVEKQIRDRLRKRRAAAGAPDRLNVPELVRALAGAELRSWFVHEGRLGVITLRKAGRKIELLGPIEDVLDELDSWRFSVRRLADGQGSARRLTDAAVSARAAAGRLAVLLGLGDHPEGTPLVIVPTGVLRGVAWHSLPPLERAPASVVPSAMHWLTARGASPPSDRVLVAAGPALSAAEREVIKVAEAHGNAVTLSGDGATADAVSEGLNGAAVGHLAAHGEFRWDNPLFSALHFADGPLWLHDLERLEHPPHTLVLSSCDMALDRVIAGDAVVGMASGLLRLGVSSLIAPVLPVPDEETADFMIGLHERMAAGATGSEALAATAAAFVGDTPRREAVRQSFVAFGA